MNNPKTRIILSVAILLALAAARLTLAADASATAHANKGVQLSQQGALDQAVVEFNEAIKIDPKDVRFYRDRGGVYLTMKRFQEAVTDFAKVVELAPKAFPRSKR